MLKPLFLLFWIGLHPVHIGLISMEYSPESGGFKTFIKLYSDDFILDYNTLSKDNPQIDFLQNKNIVKEQISNYLNDKIELYADSLKIEGEVLDYENSDGEIKINQLYRLDKKSNIYTVKCRIMSDIYHDQANFLIFKYYDFEEGIKLTFENPAKSFKTN